jgi:acyl carrier protein
MPVRLDQAALRAQAAMDALPPMLRLLAPAPARRTADTSGLLRQRLAGLGQPDRDKVVLELVVGHIATVLGHSSAAAVKPKRPFSELGFDSLAAVELRNRLNAATGLTLPATAVFDYPNPAALSDFLGAELGRREATADPAGFADLDQLEAALTARAADDDWRRRTTSRLRAMLATLAGPASADDDGVDLHTVSSDELFEIAQRELGIFPDDERPQA